MSLNKDYFWVPINWEVADYLLQHYREDWEGITPNACPFPPYALTRRRKLVFC